MNRYTTLLNGGSLAGAIAFALFLVYFYVLGMNPLGGIKFLSIFVPVVVMYFSMKKYKEVEGEGFMTYGQGFVAGLIFSFVYASLNGMLIYLYGLVIDGSFLELFITDNLETLGQTKDQMISLLGEGTYKEMIAEFQNIGLGDLALSDFQSKLMGGIIITLIMAAILRQNPPVFDHSDDN
jgi:hypothetical protein